MCGIRGIDNPEYLQASEVTAAPQKDSQVIYSTTFLEGLCISFFFWGKAKAPAITCNLNSCLQLDPRGRFHLVPHAELRLACGCTG